MRKFKPYYAIIASLVLAQSSSASQLFPREIYNNETSPNWIPTHTSSTELFSSIESVSITDTSDNIVDSSTSYYIPPSSTDIVPSDTESIVLSPSVPISETDTILSSSIEEDIKTTSSPTVPSFTDATFETVLSSLIPSSEYTSTVISESVTSNIETSSTVNNPYTNDTTTVDTSMDVTTPLTNDQTSENQPEPTVIVVTTTVGGDTVIEYTSTIGVGGNFQTTITTGTTLPGPVTTDLPTTPDEINTTNTDDDNAGEVIPGTTVTENDDGNANGQVPGTTTDVSYIRQPTTTDEGENPYHPESPTIDTNNNLAQFTTEPVYTVEPTRDRPSRTGANTGTQLASTTLENAAATDRPTEAATSDVVAQTEGTRRDPVTTDGNQIGSVTTRVPLNSQVSQAPQEQDKTNSKIISGISTDKEIPGKETGKTTVNEPTGYNTGSPTSVIDTHISGTLSHQNSITSGNDHEGKIATAASNAKGTLTNDDRDTDIYNISSDNKLPERTDTTNGKATSTPTLQTSGVNNKPTQITDDKQPGTSVTEDSGVLATGSPKSTSESGRVGLHKQSSGTAGQVADQNPSYTITPGSSKKPSRTETDNTIANAGAVTTQKSKVSRTPTPIPYTLSSSDNWLPSSIIVQHTSIKQSKSSINPSQFPTSLPVAIAAANVVDEPSDTTLITIGFGQELNYNFLVENPLSSAQIFNFLPQALYYPFYVDENTDDEDFNVEYDVFESTYASSSVSAGTTTLSPTSRLVKRLLTPMDGAVLITGSISNASRIINTKASINRKLLETTTSDSTFPSSTEAAALNSNIPSVNLTEIRVKQISPYVDSNKDYVVAVAEVYFPSEYVEKLKEHLNNKNSLIYANPVPSLKSLMNLTDPSVAIEGLIHAAKQGDNSSLNSTQSNLEGEQQVNQVFKSSIKNGTQYGSLDVTGIKRKYLPRNIRVRLVILVLCLVFGLFFWILVSFVIFRLFKRRWVQQNKTPVVNPRTSFLNVTKIGLYGDDIGSLWSGSSSNESSSLNEKLKHVNHDHSKRNQRFTYLSEVSGDKSLCYANFIQNANGDTILGTNIAMTPNVHFQFSDDNHQTISSYDSSEYSSGTSSFNFDLMNTTNNPFSDNYRVRPKSKTIDLFADDVDENFEFSEDVTSESVADIHIEDLDELDEELYNNLMDAIKDRPSNDPLTIEAKKLMVQISKNKQTEKSDD